MYIPGNFHIKDEAEIFDFIQSNAFGQLFSNVNGRLFSTHLPVLLSEDRKYLIGHLARANPQHLQLDGQEVLVTLTGPHGYISPSWYENPGVPTWNYQAVHIYARARVFDDREKLMGVVEALTRNYERDQAEPWRPAYNEVMLKAIIGIELEIEEIQCKFKLGQNRVQEDIAGAVKNLRATGAVELAAAMEKHALGE
ncbi:FMN-binding negative transcriptional regulator [Biformimicrobium ophioploci]|uniref:Protease synthase/sporulation negative transcriptional regulator PaiB n=1 Tax=Biformimicrobium ophioploci TaxID=3036711 RepID=A0ABQ6LW11_9GAMM|nr:FMN-binding negative transcriptional regulator [Microbulbifer sp. NKW57]GMG86273.1 protease synthase/sporulation negative transcriptional regulator PaiB [Microbulbifer sp. NKW57]